MNKIAITFLSSLLLAACSKESSTSANTQKSQASALASAPLANPPTAKTPELKIDKGPWDGPFGLKMGLSGDQLRAALPDIKMPASNVYFTSRPPKPHESFVEYYLVTSASSGLCKISAMGNSVQTSQFGDELRKAHKTLKTALIEKYGTPTGDHDFIKNGSLWTEPKYWMMGLLKKDRVLATTWGRKTEKYPKGLDLPNDLDSIILNVTADSTDAGYVTLKYAFTNEDACFEENNKEKNKSL